MFLCSSAGRQVLQKSVNLSFIHIRCVGAEKHLKQGFQRAAKSGKPSCFLFFIKTEPETKRQDACWAAVSDSNCNAIKMLLLNVAGLQICPYSSAHFDVKSITGQLQTQCLWATITEEKHTVMSSFAGWWCGQKATLSSVCKAKEPPFIKGQEI